MRIRIAVFTAIAAILLGGCGSGSSSSTSSSGGTSAAAMSSAPTSSSTTTSGATSSGAGTNTSATASSSGPTAAAIPANLCRAGQLQLSFLGGQGATGHGELGFELRNTGDASCTTGGYPGILFLDSSGASLPTTPQHTTDDFFGHVALRPLTIAPGASFSFRLGVSHGQASSAGCQTAYGLQVIAPNDTATLRVKIPNGASECGATTVSPVASGTSAFR